GMGGSGSVGGRAPFAWLCGADRIARRGPRLEPLQQEGKRRGERPCHGIVLLLEALADEDQPLQSLLSPQFFWAGHSSALHHVVLPLSPNKENWRREVPSL